MAGPRFRTARRKLAPRWLTSGDGELVGYALDLVADAFVERLRLGLLARFPEQDPEGTPGPADAAAAMGRDRRVVRGINEGAVSYARRLLRWLDDRQNAGGAIALMQKLAEYTGPGVRFRTVDARGNWYTREVDGSFSWLFKATNWDWDGKPPVPRWSRFWVIVYPNGLWVPNHTWGDGVPWGEPSTTWGSSITPDQAATLRSLVADWKPDGTRCVNIILAFDSASFDPAAAIGSPGLPDGLWEHWSKDVGGVLVPARLASARYLDGA